MRADTVSTTADVEEWMIVRVRHDFGTVLDRNPVTVADTSEVLPYPPSDDASGEELAGTGERR